MVERLFHARARPGAGDAGRRARGGLPEPSGLPARPQARADGGGSCPSATPSRGSTTAASPRRCAPTPTWRAIHAGRGRCPGSRTAAAPPRMGGRRLQLRDRPAGADRRAAAGPAIPLRGARVLGSDAAVARAGVRAERGLPDPGAAGGRGRQARRSCLHPHRADARRTGPARRGSRDHHAPAQFLRPRTLLAARPRRGARRPPGDPGVGAGDRLHRHLRPVRGARGSGRRRRHAAGRGAATSA